MPGGFFRRLFGAPEAEPVHGPIGHDPRYHTVSPERFFADPAMWEAAPSTSHLHSWAYYAQGGESELRVRFKDKHSGGVSAEYFYRRVPQAVFDGFRKAAHPGQFGHRYIWYAYETGDV
jgi:hypothetical protein